MGQFLNQSKTFLQNINTDERIPKRDLLIIKIMLVLIISPLDFIPDWISLYGLLDDVLMLALICDYLFNILDQAILLTHYPWGMKSFASIRKIANIFSFFSPNFISNSLWLYKKAPF